MPPHTNSSSMVKLFVGNLSPNVTSDTLRKLFSAHGTVQECDVIKNYAFVHMSTDDEANSAVRHLDNHIVEGRPIHIEKSTSRLRKAPGMSTVCFRCGASDHKTPSCPHDNNNNGEQGGRGRRSPATNGSKRFNSRDGDIPRTHFSPYPLPMKRDTGYSGFGPGTISGPTPSYGSAPGAPAPTTYGYYAGQHGSAGGAAPPPQQPQQLAPAPAPAPYQPVQLAPAAPAPAPQPQPQPQPQRSAKEMDPVLPRPADRDLENLYSQYMDSRERYYYFREKLEKELMARARGGSDPFAVGAVPQMAAPVPQSYATSIPQAAPVPTQYGAPAYQPAPAPIATADPYQTQPNTLGASQSLVRYPDMYYQQQQQQAAQQQQQVAPQPVQTAAPAYSAPQPSYAPPPTGYANTGTAGYGTTYAAVQPAANPRPLY